MSTNNNRVNPRTLTLKCHAVYANNQGAKSGLCPFYPTAASESGLLTRQRGHIIQLLCIIKFLFFLIQHSISASLQNSIANISDPPR